MAKLARPGGNATERCNFVPELDGKQIELLRAAVPQLSRVAVMYDPVNPVTGPALDKARGPGVNYL